MTAAGGTGLITVSTTSSCSWTATSTVEWITVSGSGTGSGSVTYTVAPNTETSQRTGEVQIGNKVVTFTQAAAAAPLAPTGLTVTGSGGVARTGSPADCTDTVVPAATVGST